MKRVGGPGAHKGYPGPQGGQNTRKNAASETWSQNFIVKVQQVKLTLLMLYLHSNNVTALPALACPPPTILTARDISQTNDLIIDLLVRHISGAEISKFSHEFLSQALNDLL